MNIKTMICLMSFSIACFGSGTQAVSVPLSASHALNAPSINASQVALEKLRNDHQQVRQALAKTEQSVSSVKDELGVAQQANTELWNTDAGVLRKQLNTEKEPLCSDQVGWGMSGVFVGLLPGIVVGGMYLGIRRR